MNYCIKFDNKEVFARDADAAFAAFRALQRSYTYVELWQGSELVGKYDNRK